MAHTLSIYDGVESTTLALASTSSSAAGYFLEGYTPMDPAYTVSYNSSMYTDGARPVYSKAGNIVETISVFIRGSSADDAMLKLRALKRAIWNARDAAQYPLNRQPCYLIFTPHGTTNGAYSVILGGSVMEPATLLDTDINASEIRNVIVTIEREPVWRGQAPTRSDGAKTLITSQTGITNDWYSLSVSSVSGDIPALAGVYVRPTTGSFSNVIVGYESARRNPSYYNLDPLIEAESLTNGTDTTEPANAGASGGFASEITFATTATNARRIYGTTSRQGRYRCYMRAYLDTSNTCTAQLVYGERFISTWTPTYNQTITITGASQWRLYDLGPVVTPRADEASKTGGGTYLEFYAARTSGSASLYVDFFYMMPTEGFLSCSNFTASSSDTSSYYYSNIFPWATFNGLVYYDTAVPHFGGVGSGQLRLPPGAGRLSILCGDSNWRSAIAGDPTASTKAIYLHGVPLYLGARGNS